MSAPQPVVKGVFVEIATGKRVKALFLQHNAEAQETVADDCYITLSTTLKVGEAGMWPVDEFKKRFKFEAAK